MIEGIIAAVIAAQPLIEVALEVLIIPALIYFLKQNRDKTQNDKLIAAIDIAVAAAEQLAKRDKLEDKEHARSWKLNFVKLEIKKRFPDLDEDMLMILIEAAVAKFQQSKK